MHHYTDLGGYNAIRATPVWRFIASQPAGNHPFGAYFTTLPANTPNLAKKLRIPASKLTHIFVFVDVGDLNALPGGRGAYVLFAPVDYHVARDRQIHHGAT
jgi:hypothetical protein